jgi:hypothetical protein
MNDRFNPIALMTGLAGSHGPMTTFLYFCNPISHQLHPPIVRHVSRLPSTTPAVAAPSSTRDRHADTASAYDEKRSKKEMATPRIWRRCRRNTGKRPKTSMEKRVKRNVSGAGQAGGEDCGGHDGGIGGEGGRESVNHQSWCFLK